MEYFFLAILFWIFTILEQMKYNRGVSKIFLGIFSIIMILFVGLRDGSIVGTDSPAYYTNYLYKYWDVEYGYKYLNMIFSENGIHYNIFLLFINGISIYNISKFIKYNSPYFLLSLFVYFSDFFLYYNFSGIRQAIALSFTALSINYIVQDKKVKAFFLIVLGGFFHITALIFLLSLVVPKKIMAFKSYIKFIAILLIGSVVVNFVIENVEYIAAKFKFYSELQEQSDNIQTVYIIGLLKRSIVFWGIFLVRKTFFERNNAFLFNIYLIGFIIYIATYLISPDFGVRFSTYFTIVDCILVASILKASSTSAKRIGLFLLFLSMIIYKVYTYTIVEAYEYKLFI